MIWAVLLALGVPLWLCAIGILALVFRNRTLRKRPGNVPVRVRRAGKKRWVSGHGLWVSDVFAWRGSPAAWSEDLVWIADVSARPPDAEERKKLRRIGDDPLIASLTLAEGGAIDVAARREDRASLLGPFADTARSVGTAAETQREAAPPG